MIDWCDTTVVPIRTKDQPSKYLLLLFFEKEMNSN